MIKVIYLVPKKTFIEKMSRVRFHQIEEIAKITNLVYSGPGWENYDQEKTVTENIKIIYKNELPKAIIAFDHLQMKEFATCKITKVNMMNEMHSPDGDKKKALDMLVSAKYDFIICHHKNEMEHPIFNSIRSKMTNIPHHVNQNIFKDYNLEKSIDVLLCGSLILEKYQLRRRFIEVIEMLKKQGVNAKIHQNPGGFHNDSHSNKYMIDFAKAINSSKICLTCSSVHKCAFAKYTEIPLCNSLLAGDLPDERKDFFKSFMLVLDENKSNEEFVFLIKKTLSNEKEIENLTKTGMQKNKKLSMDNYAKIFVEKLEKFLKNKERKIYG